MTRLYSTILPAREDHLLHSKRDDRYTIETEPLLLKQARKELPSAQIPKQELFWSPSPPLDLMNVLIFVP